MFASTLTPPTYIYRTSSTRTTGLIDTSHGHAHLRRANIPRCHDAMMQRVRLPSCRIIYHALVINAFIHHTGSSAPKGHSSSLIPSAPSISRGHASHAHQRHDHTIRLIAERHDNYPSRPTRSSLRSALQPAKSIRPSPVHFTHETSAQPS